MPALFSPLSPVILLALRGGGRPAKHHTVRGWAFVLPGSVGVWWVSGELVAVQVDWAKKILVLKLLCVSCWLSIWCRVECRA